MDSAANVERGYSLAKRKPRRQPISDEEEGHETGTVVVDDRMDPACLAILILCGIMVFIFVAMMFWFVVFKTQQAKSA